MPHDEQLVTDIVVTTSGIPFYIQAVVDRLRAQPGVPVADIVERSIVDSDWHTKHYVTRLDDYYGADALVARAVVDELALAHPAALGIDELLSRVALSFEEPLARDLVINLLDKLETDHYLVRDGNSDRMTSALLATIWRLHRRLG